MTDNPHGLEFDLTTLTAYEYDALLEASTRRRNRELAKYIAKICVKCPPKWGKPDNPDTYGNLPFLTLFQDVIKAMNAAFTSFEGNSDAPSANTSSTDPNNPH